MKEGSALPADPLSPPPPQAAYFDPAAGAWVLSRYADVLAAFRELRLWPIGQRGEDHYSLRDETGKLYVRGEMLDAVSPARLAPWQSHMEALAATAVEQLPTTGRSTCLPNSHSPGVSPWPSW